MSSYGDKKKDMARSILPSKSKSIYKDKKILHRRIRRTAKNNLKLISSYLEEEDIEEDNLSTDELEYIDLKYFPNHEINYLVRSRRGYDKLNHFIRWSKEVTKDMAKEDRLSHIKSILPKNLIGEHAVSHLKWLEHFNLNEARYIRYHNRSNQHSLTSYRYILEATVMNSDSRYLKLLNAMIRESNFYPHSIIIGYKPVVVNSFGIPEMYPIIKTVPKESRILKNALDLDKFIEDIISAATEPRFINDFWFEKKLIINYLAKKMPKRSKKESRVVSGYSIQSIKRRRINLKYNIDQFNAVCNYINLWLYYKADYVEMLKRNPIPYKKLIYLIPK